MSSHLRFFKLAEEEDEIGTGREYLSTHLPSKELLTCLANNFMTEKVKKTRMELLIKLNYLILTKRHPPGGWCRGHRKVSRK